MSEEEETEGEEEEVDDIIVTTHRRIVRESLLFAERSALTRWPLQKKRGTKSTEPSQPTITRVEETTVVVDAHTQTDTVSMTEMHVQTDLSATTIDLVPPVELPVVQVVEEPTPKTGREIQEELAKELGIDWTKLSEFVEGQKAPPSVPKPFADPSFAGVMSARRAGRWATRLSSRIPNAAAQAPSFLINVRCVGRVLLRAYLADRVPFVGLPQQCSPLRLADPRQLYLLCALQHRRLPQRSHLWQRSPSP